MCVSQTCNDPVVIRHTRQLEERNGEGMKETARGGKEGLFALPYFLSQHPLSSRGKVYSRGQGSPWRHSFCSLPATLCMLSPSVMKACAFLSLRSLKISGPADYFSVNVSPQQRTCRRLCSLQRRQRRDIRRPATPSEREGSAALCSGGRGETLFRIVTTQPCMCQPSTVHSLEFILPPK